MQGHEMSITTTTTKNKPVFIPKKTERLIPTLTGCTVANTALTGKYRGAWVILYLRDIRPFGYITVQDFQKRANVLAFKDNGNYIGEFLFLFIFNLYFFIVLC